MDSKVRDLVRIANKARQLMVEVLERAGCGHPGGAFSSIDLMVALYFDVMKINSKNSRQKERDRFILSKGHSSVALYTVLYLKGFIDYQTLMSFRQDGSILGGHPDMRKIPGVEMSTGSLGHGLSVGAGLALSANLDKRRHKIFVLMGDGETQEGSVWEAAMFSSHYKLDNLVGIIDRNMLQTDGCTEDAIRLEPYKSKWESFGWEVKEIDGHNLFEVSSALKKAPFRRHKPSMVIAKTIKGKGISFMENKPQWHGKLLSSEYAALARSELNNNG